MKNPELVIRFMGGNSYFSIMVSNSMVQEEDAKKKRSRNHGHGVRNIKETVEKYEGNFEQSIDGEMFITSVYFPI